MTEDAQVATGRDDVGYQAKEECPLCKGTGFVHPVEGGQVVYSKVVPCRGPGCLCESIHHSLGTMVVEQTFETFIQLPGTEKALKASRQLASGESKFVWLLLYGRPGNGKTHLCNAIARETRNRGVEVKVVLAADLFSMLRDAIKDNRTDQLLQRFKSVEFLAIDDYGVEYGTDWEMSKFDELLTSRYALARPTVVITNKDISDLPERIQSRFKDKVMARAVANTAPDFRSSKNRR